jgi:predicted restriction endonuclease
LYCSIICSNRAQGLGRCERHLGAERRAITKAAETASCTICGFKRIIEIAHIIPANAGGLFTWANTIFLCPNHHRLFDYHILNEEEVGRLPERAKNQYLSLNTYDGKNYQRRVQKKKTIIPKRSVSNGRFVITPVQPPLLV